MTDCAYGVGEAERSFFLAHSRNRFGLEDPLRVHLDAVARRSAEFGSAFGAETEASLAGLLHDLGKYGDLFQKRLRGEVKGIDHWSPGAWVALTQYREAGIASALAIQGHHIGLQQAEKGSLASMNLAKWDPAMHEQRRLSEANMETLLQRLRADGLMMPAAPEASLYNHTDKAVSAMLGVRMLFSALVDADFIETEAHFETRGGGKMYRDASPVLNPTRALAILLSHIKDLPAKSRAAGAVNKLRADLLEACLAAAEKPQGQFTLTAPTGSGKTLAMLAFALKHAAVHNLRRVVMVIPYLSIIDQTANVYRNILQNDFGSGYILEGGAPLQRNHRDD